ncbi:MAG: LysM domain-containing protein [Eubacteriales bacterium]|nr:LysM domain-containing protein [Eubacteriales bacterium]
MENAGIDGVFVYIIEEQDTLFDILRRFDISVRDLIAYNRTCDLFSLKPGQAIFIRDMPRNSGAGYVLKENESLWSVAKKFDLCATALLRANPHLLPQEIKPGIKIKLPD